MNRAPEWQLSLMAQYTFPIAGFGTLTPRVEWQYVDELFHDENNTQPQGSESFDIINVKLRFESNDSRWGAELYARNADNTSTGRIHSREFCPPSCPASTATRAYSVARYFSIFSCYCCQPMDDLEMPGTALIPSPAVPDTD